MKQITFPIAAGAVSSNLAWFPYFIDLGKLGNEFWDFVNTNGSDMKAYAADLSRLPMDIVYFDKAQKAGGIYVRTPVSTAGTDILLQFEDPGAASTPPNDIYGQFAVWFGYLVFVDFRGGAKNRLNNTPLTIVGTVNNGDGPARWATFKQPTWGQFSGYYKVTGLPVRNANFSMGGVGQRNPSSLGWMALCSFGEDNASKGKYEAFGWPYYDSVIQSYNDGYDVIEGGPKKIGEPQQIGLTVGASGASQRTIYVDGVAGQSGYFKTLAARNTMFIASSNQGDDFTYPLHGAICTAWIYDGVLSPAYFQLESKNIVKDTGGSPPIDNGETPEPAMAYLAAFTSIADVVSVSPTLIADTGGSRFDNTRVKEGALVISAGSFYVPLDSAASELWLGGDVFISNQYAPTDIVTLQTSAGNPIARWRSTSAAVSPYPSVIEVYNGTSWVNVGSMAATPAEVLYHVDWYYKAGGAGEGRVQFYINGVLAVDFTGVTDFGQGSVSRVLYKQTAYTSTTFSAWIMSTTTTLPLRLHQLLATGDGAQTAWAGAYGDINELGYSDATLISTSTADAVETFAFEDISGSFSGFSFDAIVLAMRGQGSGAPGVIDGVSRISGADHVTPGLMTLPTIFGPYRVVIDKNPATGTAWTLATINAAEFGVKARTP